MVLQTFTTFSPPNRRMIFLLIISHLLWSAGVFGLCSAGRLLETALPWWSGLFLVLQLFAAAQLVLPALLLHPEERTRSFYLFWGVALGLTVWMVNRLTPVGLWQPFVDAIKSGLLLLVATLIGAMLARYVRRLWEVIPVCVVMTLADVSSWLFGPTSVFRHEIKQYYLAPDGAPPVIDMVLVKLAFPGSIGMAPVFGISDWVMVVFFVIVAGRYGINDNLVGESGESLAQQGKIGRYLPVSVVALFVALLSARSTGLFIPALPVIALIMLLWYTGRSAVLRRQTSKERVSDE